MNTTLKTDQNFIEQYSGGNYDRLSDESKHYTAISWGQYPAQSFQDLVKNAKKVNIEWAELIAVEGINYFVLSEGDAFCASGAINSDTIACDTEEWYTNIGQSKFITTSDDFENEWERLREFIDEFGFDICQEVLAVIG